MIRFIFGGIVFALIFVAIMVMVIISLSYKGIRKIREEMAENFYRRQQMKEQKEKNPFGEDYFKSSNGSRQGHRQQQYERKDYAQQKTTARKTTTSSGVTIIDDRDGGEQHKIFDSSDGEYVEFEEVRD